MTNMIAMNEKALTQPYCLSRVEFLRQFYMHAKERKIKGTIFNLSDYKTIIGNKGTKVFNPERYEVMQLQMANALAIAAGLLFKISNNQQLVTRSTTYYYYYQSSSTSTCKYLGSTSQPSTWQVVQTISANPRRK